MYICMSWVEAMFTLSFKKLSLQVLKPIPTTESAQNEPTNFLCIQCCCPSFLVILVVVAAIVFVDITNLVCTLITHFRLVQLDRQQTDRYGKFIACFLPKRIDHYWHDY